MQMLLILHSNQSSLLNGMCSNQTEIVFKTKKILGSIILQLQAHVLDKGTLSVVSEAPIKLMLKWLWNTNAVSAN